ncbi:hypothetical protein BDZ45DRAFT_237480 [Acephala macrosclerotiorum]|nr:hypothetical protein BDZ45DRAFT_237480 [Acephala macrosclerotiorum]
MDPQDHEWEEIEGREAAEKHIQEIRTSRGLGGSSVPRHIVVEILKPVCKIIANQLYEEPTHFFLELIQNANDNKFTCSEPTLVITYENKNIQVECNEVGFSPENVAAICSLGKSSKKQPGDWAAYVGEKGIGFKSVFRVADVVWVSSRGYNFKFDSTADLGMITPINEAFPVPKLPGWTSFYLQLRNDGDGLKVQQKIRAELEGFDARLLLFLQKLGTIKINIADGDQGVRTCVFSRANTQFSGDEMVNLTQDKVTTSYLIHRYMMTSLPVEERRGGVNSSEIVLAFPIDRNKEPIIAPQQVFAFLPIYDFGFSVILQADFVLTANREGLERSNEWNRELRNGLIQAFGDAARRLDNTVLRYTWVRYLPESSGSDIFFEKLKGGIRDTLSVKTIVRAWNESLQRPDKAVYVPEKFRDQNSIPLTLGLKKSHIYLSRNYKEVDFKYLRRLGVREMSYTDFLTDLEDFLKEYFEDFTKKPLEWQSRLARALNNPLANHPLESLRGLRLILLRTGEWVSSEVGAVFFPGDLERTVPGGIDTRIVDLKAASDPARRQLYSHLGVTNFEVSAIQGTIVQLHASGAEPGRLSISNLIAQAHFLFSTRWANHGNAPIWVATDRELRTRGDEVYIDNDGLYTASKVFAKNRAAFKFLHSDYLLAHAKDQASWVEWLEKNLGVTKIPRLVPHREPFQLSADFKFIIKSLPCERWLEIFCENWEEYKKWLEPKVSNGNPTDKKCLVSELSGIEVTCIGRMHCRLRDSFLPVDELVSAADGLVPFLCVREPDHARWQALGCLGVRVKNDVSFYLLCLSRLAGSGLPVKLSRVELLLNRIEAHLRRGDQQYVREFFQSPSRRLIFVPSPKPSTESEPPDQRLGCQLVDSQSAYDDDEGDDDEIKEGSWHHLNQCLWNGPPYFRVNVILNCLYPSNKHLFKDVLNVSEVAFSHFLAEARSFTMSDSKQYMSKILIAMDKFISSHWVSSDDYDELRLLRIWPISSQNWEPHTQLRSAALLDEWFIADRSYWRGIFGKVVPILDFEFDDLYRMGNIFKKLNCNRRFMTLASKTVPRFEGIVKASCYYTKSFRSKYRFIARLLNSIKDNTNRGPHLARLKKVEVFTAEHILERHIIPHQNNEVGGESSQADAIVIREEDKLIIYMTQSYFDTDKTLDEIVTSLGWALEMDPIKHSLQLRMLYYVLALEDYAKITYFLDKNWIPMDLDTDDDEDDWIATNVNVDDGDDNWTPRSPNVDDDDDGSITPTRRGSELVAWEESGRTGTEAGGSGFLVISSANFDHYAHLFLMGRGAGCQVRVGDGFGASRSRGLSSGLGSQAIMPSTEASGAGRYWDAYEDDGDYEHLQFLGELEVANLVGKILGKNYVPTEHWTSPHRAKAGIVPFISADGKSGPAFMIRDSDGIFTRKLTVEYPDIAKLLGRNPNTWYLEVKASYGGLAEEFSLTWEEFERARKLSRMRRSLSQLISTDALALVRVYGVGNEPQIAFFVDPWMQYIDNKFQFQCDRIIKGRLITECRTG